MRVAPTAALLAASLLVAGCAGPGANDPADADNTTTFTENERGAHPVSPAADANDTTTTANGTATPGVNGSDTGGNATETAGTTAPVAAPVSRAVGEVR